MRVAIIRQRYSPYGGAERFIENALEALLERNVALTLYTREWPQTRLQLMEPHIVDPFYVGSLWRDWGFARAVCRAVGHARLDLVQSHERVLCCDVFRAGDGVHAVWLEERLRGAAWHRRLAVAASPHHRYLLAMERRLFASPWLSAVICNSRMVRDEIHERFGVADDKLHVVYNAVDSDDFSPALRRERGALRTRHAIRDDAVVFLQVGSGFERKNVAASLRALAELPAHARLIVVGRERDPGTYEQLARRLGVADRVVFAGAQMDPRPYYGAADAFVLPTLYDPFPNAALEAMACGLPVITSTKSGAAELVRERDAGLVCASRDIAALAAHMRLLLDAGQRERLGANARAAVLPLTPAAMTLKLVLIYRDLLAGIAARREARRSRSRSAAAGAHATPAATAANVTPGTPAANAAPATTDANPEAAAAGAQPADTAAQAAAPKAAGEPANAGTVEATGAAHGPPSSVPDGAAEPKPPAPGR